ncbi:hypothetical protein LINPERHAP1_LOCUS13684 [Linum perenne]
MGPHTAIASSDSETRFYFLEWAWMKSDGHDFAPAKARRLIPCAPNGEKTFQLWNFRRTLGSAFLDRSVSFFKLLSIFCNLHPSSSQLITASSFFPSFLPQSPLPLWFLCILISSPSTGFRFTEGLALRTVFSSSRFGLSLCKCLLSTEFVDASLPSRWSGKELRLAAIG